MFKAKNDSVGTPPEVPKQEGSKKTFYKKWWFWVIVVVLVAALGSGGDSDSARSSNNTENTNKVVESISASYSGSTEAGTEINDNSSFTVTVQYEDGTTEKVSDWQVVEPATLAAGQTSTVTIKYKDKTTDVNVACTTIDEASFKASCQNIAYEELARNGDNYIGTPITFRGQIIQVMEGDGFTAYRINVTQDSYGFWDDTMYVEYTVKEGESRFLEDDIVTVYGTCMGLYTYETVMGANVTIPSAIAEFMELS